MNIEPEVSKSATVVETLDVTTFCRVVDLGSITDAARSLGETKGYVSRRIARLESTLGTPLLRRNGRRVEPTDEGLLYREKAGHALDVLEDAAAILRDARAAPSGTLRLTAPPGIGNSVLSQTLPKFLAQYPGINVEMILTDAVLSFGEHRLDVALRISRRLPDSSLIAHHLFDLAGILVASPEYLARKGTPTHPSDLEHHDLLIVPIRGRTQPVTFEHADGSSLDLALTGRALTHDALLLKDLAKGGAGITYLTQNMVDDDITNGSLVQVLSDWPIQRGAGLYLVHQGGAIAPKVRAFRDFFKAEMIHLRAKCGLEAR